MSQSPGLGSQSRPLSLNSGVRSCPAGVADGLLRDVLSVPNTVRDRLLWDKYLSFSCNPYLTGHLYFHLLNLAAPGGPRWGRAGLSASPESPDTLCKVRELSRGCEPAALMPPSKAFVLVCPGGSESRLPEAWGRW